MIKELSELRKKMSWGEATDKEIAKIQSLLDTCLSIVKEQVLSTLSKTDDDTITYTCQHDFSGLLTGPGRGGRLQLSGYIKRRNFTKNKLKQAEVTIDKATFVRFLRENILKQEETLRRVSKSSFMTMTNFREHHINVNKMMIGLINGFVDAPEQPLQLDLLESPLTSEPKLTVVQQSMKDARNAFNAYRKSRKDLEAVLTDQALKYCPTSTDHLLVTNTQHETCFSFHIGCVLLEQLNRFKVEHGMSEIHLESSVDEKGKYVSVTCNWFQGSTVEVR